MGTSSSALIGPTQGVVDVMQDGYNIQDTSLLYYAGPDMSVESPEV
jgi:hypothetical protein